MQKSGKKIVGDIALQSGEESIGETMASKATAMSSDASCYPSSVGGYSGDPSAEGQWKVKTEETAPRCLFQQPAAAAGTTADQGPLSVTLNTMDDVTDSRLVMNEDSMSTNSMSYPESPGKV